MAERILKQVHAAYLASGIPRVVWGYKLGCMMGNATSYQNTSRCKDAVQWWAAAAVLPWVVPCVDQGGGGGGGCALLCLRTWFGQPNKNYIACN